MSWARLPLTNTIEPHGAPVFPLQVNEKTFGAVSFITITSPAGTIAPGDVYAKTASPVVNNKEVLLNSFSVKYINVLAGMSLAATNEKPSGVT